VTSGKNNAEESASVNGECSGLLMTTKCRVYTSEKDVLVKLHVTLTLVLRERGATVAADPTEGILFWWKQEACKTHLKERVLCTKVT
jgi:hypothetical protein